MKEFGETCVYTCRKQVRVVALIIGLMPSNFVSRSVHADPVQEGIP